MLDNLILAATVIGGLNGLFGGIAIRRVAFLEQKISLLWRVILIQGVAMLLAWVAVLVGARQFPRLPPIGELGIEQLRAHLVAARDHHADVLLALTSVPMLLVVLVPSVLFVLTEVKAFALAHRADLLARDQAALWQDREPKPEPAAKS